MLELLLMLQLEYFESSDPVFFMAGGSTAVSSTLLELVKR